MRQEGFRLLDIAATWQEVLAQGYERRVHAVALVDAEDWQVAMQLMARRSPGEVPRPLFGAYPAACRARQRCWPFARATE